MSDTMNRIINYDLNGGEIPSDFTLITKWSFGSRRALPIPVREGAVFVGWFADGKNITNLSPSVVYNGMEIVARFEDLSPEPVEEGIEEAEPEVVEVDEDEEIFVVTEVAEEPDLEGELEFL